MKARRNFLGAALLSPFAFLLGKNNPFDDKRFAYHKGKKYRIIEFACDQYIANGDAFFGGKPGEMTAWLPKDHALVVGWIGRKTMHGPVRLRYSGYDYKMMACEETIYEEPPQSANFLLS